jgi:hypothetical protein
MPLSSHRTYANLVLATTEPHFPIVLETKYARQAEPLPLVVFLLCSFRTPARNAYFACVDRKNPGSLSPLRSTYGKVPTCFYLSRLHHVRPMVYCHYISFRIPTALHLLSHIRFEASTTASSGPMPGRVGYPAASDNEEKPNIDDH